MTTDKRPLQPAHTLGTALRDLRKAKGMTGEQLGKHVGLSQSKISKIEKGYPPLPDPETLEHLLDRLEAPKNIRREVQQLLMQLGSAPQFHSHYIAQYLSGKYSEFERTATLVQVVTYNVIPALLQTAAYREAVGQALGVEGSDIEAFMRESFLRQDLIWEKTSNYEFLIHEAALYTMPATAQDQLAQLDKLERLIGLSNLEIGIVPTTSGLPALEPSNYVMYDKQHIIRSAGVIELETHDAETALQYLQYFEELSLKARFGRDAAQLIDQAARHITENSNQ